MQWRRLYTETDKHVVDRMDDLCVAFMENGVHMEDIENVYVLGHPLLRQIWNILNFFMQLLGVTVTMKQYLRLDIWIWNCLGPC